MLTSLAMAQSNGTTIIACGMESGTLVFHDLAMLNGSRSNASVVPDNPCRLSLSTDPILSLDMTPSPASPQSAPNAVQGSVVAIAGMAGNSEDLAELPERDRGRVAVVKASLRQDGLFQARLRARLSTCDVHVRCNEVSGKPGVAVCRFRPDGRIFAVGGWDKRLRIFDRGAAANPLAILRGHSKSVNAMDWSSDSAVTGFLATGSSDGRVHVWRCFPSGSKSRPEIL
jgi:WD40 repeat protein